MRCATAVLFLLRGAAPTTRLLLFVAVSVALHSVSLGVSFRSATGTQVSAAASVAPALHATLVRSGNDAATPQSSSAMPGKPGERDSDRRREAQEAPDLTQASAGPRAHRYPVADKWYSASELDVRAEPLDAVEFEYPRSPGGGVMIGRVELALYVDERGYVRKLEVRKSEPERVFDEAALRGWKDVRFSPAMRGGTAVKSEKIIQVDFQP
jgi:TonB family protein